MSDSIIENRLSDAANLFAQLGLMGEEGVPVVLDVGVRVLPPLVRPPDLPCPVRQMPKALDHLAMVNKNLAHIGPSAVVTQSFTWQKELGMPGLQDKSPTAQVTARSMPANFSVYGFGWAHACGVLNSKVFVDAEKEEVHRTLSRVKDYYKGNGDWSCVMDRFTKYLKIVPVVLPVSPKLATQLPLMLPQNEVLRAHWVTQFRRAAPMAVLAEIPLNMDGGTGFPYEVSRQELSIRNPAGYKAMYDQVIIALQGGPDALRSLLREHPLWFVFCQKAKVELYESKCMDAPIGARKARPYNALNAALAHVFQLLAKPMTACTIPFLVKPGSPEVEGLIPLPHSGWKMHPTSHSAIGFSWVHGGATALWEYFHFMNHTLKDGEVRFVSYSDDQLWVRKFDGVLWIYTPDVDQMDARITSVHTRLVHQFILTQYSRDKSLGVWGPFLDLWCQMAVNYQTLMQNGIVVSVKDRLATGIPGTTMFDQMGSMYMHARVKIESDKNITLDPQAWMGRMAEVCAGPMVGMPLKPDSLAPVNFLLGEQEGNICAKFLGYSLARKSMPVGEHTHVWVPYSDPEKAFVSFLRPGKRFTGESSTTQTNVLQVTRLRQLYAQAIWHSDTLSKVSFTMFNTLVKTGCRPIPVSLTDGIPDDTAGLDVLNVFLPVLPGVDWPTHNQILSLYAPSGWVAPDQLHTPTVLAVQDLADFYDISGGWGGATEVATCPLPPVPLPEGVLVHRKVHPEVELRCVHGNVRLGCRGKIRTDSEILARINQRQDAWRAKVEEMRKSMTQRYLGFTAQEKLATLAQDVVYQEAYLDQVQLMADAYAEAKDKEEEEAYKTWCEQMLEEELEWTEEAALERIRINTEIEDAVEDAFYSQGAGQWFVR